MYPSVRKGSLMRLVSLIKTQNWNRPAPEIAIDLIYAYNLWKCPVDKIEFGFPQMCDQRPEITDDPNSFVPTKIDPTYDGRFEGLNGFMYRRLPVEVIGPPSGPIVRPKQYPFYTYDELDAINEYLGIQLRKEDVYNVLYTEDQPEYKLYIHPHALVWLPGEITFIAGPPGPSEVLIKNADLSGFTRYSP